MALWTLYRFETRLAMTSGGGMLTGVIFFLSLVTMIPFAIGPCLLYTSPSPRDLSTSRMPSSA